MQRHWLKIVLIALGCMQGSFVRAADAEASRPLLFAAAKKVKKTVKKKKVKAKPAATTTTTETPETAESGGGMLGGIQGGEGAPGSFMAAGNAGYIFYNTGIGAEASYVLLPKLQIGGRFARTFKKTITASAEGNNLAADITQTNIAGFGRYFFLPSMPSLYALGSLSYSTVSGPYELEVPVAAVNQIFYFYSDIKATAILLTGGIGNQWSWGSLVFGADWFSYSFPVSLSSTANPDGLTDVDNNPPPQPLTDGQKSALNGEVEKKVREGARFQFLVFYAGMRF